MYRTTTDHQPPSSVEIEDKGRKIKFDMDKLLGKGTFGSVYLYKLDTYTSSSQIK